jgi:hypothetical protein
LSSSAQIVAIQHTLAGVIRIQFGISLAAAIQDK